MAAAVRNSVAEDKREGFPEQVLPELQCKERAEVISRGNRMSKHTDMTLTVLGEPQEAQHPYWALSQEKKHERRPKRQTKSHRGS